VSTEVECDDRSTNKKEEVKNMRCVFIDRWEPGKYKEVSKRYFASLDSKAPTDVLEADKKIKRIAREFPGVYGQNCCVLVVEADEKSIENFAKPP
jgi:hypothetical protein